jgi:hypothetical protein
MSQNELDRAVATATGESIGMIRRHGFSLMMPLKVFDSGSDEMAEPTVVDWDDLELEQRRAA